MTLFYGKQPADHIIADDYIYSGKIYSALASSDTMNAKKYNDSADYYFTKVVTADTSKDKRALYIQMADVYKEQKNYAKEGYWYGRIVADNPNASSEDYFYWGLYNYYGKKFDEATKAFAAMRAKYPEEPSALYWQGRTAAAIDADSKTGGAAQFYKDWLNFKKEGYTQKPADQMNAYQYLAFYYYNSNNEKDAMEWINKILESDPTNSFAKQIKDYYAAKAGKPKGGSR